MRLQSLLFRIDTVSNDFSVNHIRLQSLISKRRVETFEWKHFDEKRFLYISDPIKYSGYKPYFAESKEAKEWRLRKVNFENENWSCLLDEIEEMERTMQKFWRRVDNEINETNAEAEPHHVKILQSWRGHANFVIAVMDKLAEISNMQVIDDRISKSYETFLEVVQDNEKKFHEFMTECRVMEVFISKFLNAARKYLTYYYSKS